LKKAGIYKQVGSENFCSNIYVALEEAENFINTKE